MFVRQRAFALVLAIVALASVDVAAQSQDEARPLTIDDLMSLPRVGDPQISPDGQWLAYTVRTRDEEEDKNRTQIWMVATGGGDPIPMTDIDTSAGRPRWSPDNRYLSFTASKGEEAETQVWTLNRLGGEAVQLTDVTQGVGHGAWRPVNK